MYYVYVLKGVKTKKAYIGYSSDLKKRLVAHNSGQNLATKHDKWELVYYESYRTKELALKRELKLKNHGKGLQELKLRIGFES
jgi:putative endonuclease